MERLQRTVRNWRAIMPPEYSTPQAEFERSLEEVAELKKAVDNDDNSLASKKEIGSEAADVVIRMLGVAESVGIDLQRVIFDKLSHTTTVKYPNDVIKTHMQRGMLWHEAMGHEKTLFEQGKGWGQRWQKHIKK